MSPTAALAALARATDRRYVDIPIRRTVPLCRTHPRARSSARLRDLSPDTSPGASELSEALLRCTSTRRSFPRPSDIVGVEG